MTDTWYSDFEEEGKGIAEYIGATDFYRNNQLFWSFCVILDNNIISVFKKKLHYMVLPPCNDCSIELPSGRSIDRVTRVVVR